MPETTPPIRIVIADDHPVFREGLRRLLQLEPGFQVVGHAANGIEAVEQVATLQPDVLLLDLLMPKAGGLEALAEIAERRLRVKAVLLTAAIDTPETVRALQLGVRGVVLKECATKMLFQCVRAVIAGEYWVGHQRVGEVLDWLQRKPEPAPVLTRGTRPASTLTQRELQIVAAIVDGATNKDIGQQFRLSEQTVKNHLSHIFDKLGVSNRLELALYAMHHRLVEGREADMNAK
jgi:DNA-binding NarL/FixJ family response regulator